MPAAASGTAGGAAGLPGHAVVPVIADVVIVDVVAAAAIGTPTPADAIAETAARVDRY